MASKKNTRADEWKKNLEKEFLAAYDENADALFRYCFLRVRDREIAKDIVQDAFSRTWLYLSQGKTVTHLRAFLYRVVNNLIVDWSRKKKSASLDAMTDDDGFEAVDESTPEPGIDHSVREAMKLLDSLDEIYRTAITMRYMQEMTPGEIAHALGVSENVVSVRIHRGIERLTLLMNRQPKSS